MAAPDAAGATRPDDEVLEIAKASIGARYGLTEQQTRRLVGTTAAELRVDAKTMAKELGIAVVGVARARDEHGRFAGSSGMNRLIRQASGR